MAPPPLLTSLDTCWPTSTDWKLQSSLRFTSGTATELTKQGAYNAYNASASNSEQHEVHIASTVSTPTAAEGNSVINPPLVDVDPNQPPCRPSSAWKGSEQLPSAHRAVGTSSSDVHQGPLAQTASHTPESGQTTRVTFVAPTTRISSVQCDTPSGTQPSATTAADAKNCG